MSRARLWIPALLVATAGLVEIWVVTLQEPGFAGPRAIDTAGVLALGAGLLARRRYPVAGLALVVAGAAAEWPYLRETGQLTFEAFLSMLIAVASLGVHAPLRRAYAGLALALAVLTAGHVADVAADILEPAETLGVYIVLAAAFGGGRLIRSRSASARASEARAARLEAEREQIVAEERRRMARELHDVVGHAISTILLQVGGARQVMASDPRDAERAMLAAEASGREALAELRRLVGLLREDDGEAELRPAPGLSGLQRLAEQTRTAGLPVELEIPDEAADLPAGVELAAYRIVQEALTNALKHAGAAHARVVVRRDPRAVHLEISDDGHGATSNGTAGHGLIGMRERVALYGGELDAGPGGEGGFVVRARLPLEATPS